MSSFRGAVRQVDRVQNAINCNRFLFWLKKIPLLKRLCPDGAYGKLGFKSVVGRVVNVLSLLYAFGGKFLYLFLACGCPVGLVYKERALSEGWGMFVGILFFLSFVTGCFLQSDILNASLIKYTCVRQMGMPARACVWATTGAQHLLAALTFTPALMVAAALFGRPVWLGLLLSLELAAARLIAEGFFLLLYHKTGFVPAQKTLYILLLVAAGLAGAYLPVLAKAALPMDRVLPHPVTAAVLLVLGALFGRYLLSYPRYPELIRDRCSVDRVTAASTPKAAARESAFRDVKLRDSDLEAAPVGSLIEKLHGYEYLNALFFHRHRRLLLKPVKIWLAVVGAAFLAGVVGVLVLGEESAPFFANISDTLRYFVFFLYLACNSLGTRMCKAMFYNCDISLLKYPWYREKNVVLKNFAVRLRRIASLNILLGAAICLAVSALTLLSGARPPAAEFIPFLLGILCLTVFFSVHPLFLYYVFQPYTTQLAVKNPFFGALNWGVYFLCYMCIYIKQPPAGFTLIVLLATLLYCAAALLLVWRRSPRTFRVK